MSDAVVVEQLEKTFPGGVRAVDGVSFAVREGEAFGFLGPNGAGKTTTVSLLTTLLRPTGGRALVDGIDVVADPGTVRRRIGLVFQESTAEDELTGRENLEISAALYGVSRSDAQKRIRDLLERMQLVEAAGRLVKTYSGGMRRRLELAAGILHRPKVLFLDEPTLGLDPQGRAGLWEYVREIRKESGTTIFVTTHYLDEADQLCDRVAIIDHGKIVAAGTPAELKEKIGGDVVTLVPTDGTADLTPVLARVPGVLQVQKQDGGYRLKCLRGESVVPAAVEACFTAHIAVASVALKKPSLDEVFLEFTGRAFREDEGPSATDTALRMNQFRQRKR
ncbi:MAG: ATP-binding cassette domain-containing protein [Thermoplasmata archaeon]|nr:ATP-binding cassette domain-containing protein [Thermoplasmata archaeon]